MKNILFHIFFLSMLIACSQKPEDIALNYTKQQYLNYEDSFQYIKPNIIPKEIYLQKKNLSFLNLNFFEKVSLFEFTIKNKKINNNYAEVQIEITRPKIDFLTLNKNKENITQAMKRLPKEKIINTITLEKNLKNEWFVIP